MAMDANGNVIQHHSASEWSTAEIIIAAACVALIVGGVIYYFLSEHQAKEAKAAGAKAAAEAEARLGELARKAATEAARAEATALRAELGPAVIEAVQAATGGLTADVRRLLSVNSTALALADAKAADKAAEAARRKVWEVARA